MEAERSFLDPVLYCEKPIRLYACGCCKKTHETRDEAKKCCSSWECISCCETYRTKKEAIECCSSWICTWCEKEFDTKKEAEKCCDDEVESN